MKEAEFRTWLEARRWKGKPLTSISSRMSKARKFEKAMPALGFADADLDAAFDRDGMTEVTERLRDWCREAAKDGTAPVELVGQTTNPSMRINNVAGAVRNYRQFREGATAASTWPALDELRDIFLDRVPDFQSFPQTDNGHERIERAYKDVMVAKVADIAGSGDDDEQAGRRIFRALIPSEGPLLAWRVENDFVHKHPQFAPDFFATIGQLARDERPIADAIMAAADRFAQLQQAGATGLTLGAITSIAITVAGMARPADAAPFKITKGQELARLLTSDAIFAGTVLTRAQLDTWLGLMKRIETVMRDDWGWAPRDLIDVQGFAWIALDDKWGDDDEMDDDALLARFDGNPLFRAVRDQWTTDQIAAFCVIARAGHAAGLDWYHTNMPRDPVRIGRKPDKDRRALAALGYLNHRRIPRIWLNDESNRPQLGTNGFPFTAGDADHFAELLLKNAEAIRNWNPPEPPRPGRWPDEAGVEIDVADSEGMRRSGENEMPKPINRILYGPPGTGKTFATAEHALELCGEAVPDDRDALMDRYRELLKAGRIEFVTFHQSMSYEEFVEGLRPTTDRQGAEDSGSGSAGGFRLRPRDGIFKQISERARLSERPGALTHLDRRRSVFKIALGRRGIEEDRINEGLDRGLIHLGWGGSIDWSDERFDSFEAIRREWHDKVDPDATGKDANIEVTYTFRAAMQVGDYVILSDGRDVVRGVGQVTGDYFYDADAGYHPHRRAVAWLWQDAAGVPRDRFYPRQFRRHSNYRLVSDDIDWDALDEIVFGKEVLNQCGDLPFVLVIDEINRANISKVFGELITLIETDKRLGLRDELKVRLPYSNDSFGVPTNLHIVGTMNTADRSIALIDKALRRRFDFVEVMPRYDLPEMRREVTGAGVTLAQVLETINHRIEYLLDREHQIGHGWLLHCDTKAKLDDAMRGRIIPLIAEYFFEDWGRTADVLGGREDNPFLAAIKLAPPPGMSEAEPRIRWAVRPEFAPDAYSRLVG